MGKSLEQYAKENPTAEPEQEREERERTANAYQDRLQIQEEADRLKESISNQIERGSAPQYVLYTAIKAIGLLTSDNEWSEKNTAALDAVYDDLRQESFIVDNAAIAMGRLKEMRVEYNAKLKRQINSQINSYRRLSEALTEAYRIVNLMDQKEDQGE